MNVMWTNAAFEMYMGRRDAFESAAFEPARRREVLLGTLADTRRTEVVEMTERTPSRLGLASFAVSALTVGRRLVRG